MATYAVGDVQGCYDDLRVLLDIAGFDAGDRLWLVGDLVNRGPHSLPVLRFVRSLGEDAVTVLGNHDLHLLAAATGARKPHDNDTFDEILAAPDRDELLDWLRHRPLLHHDTSLQVAMVHAGLPPQWTLEQAIALAGEVAAALAGDDYGEFLRIMYGNLPDRWSDDLSGVKRLRFIVNALTRMRMVHRSGRLLFGTRAESDAGARAVPWFAHPKRKSAGQRILFGHWSTLQMNGPLDPVHNVVHLDHGCVWGRKLCALRLEDETWFERPCPNYCSPD